MDRKGEYHGGWKTPSPKPIAPKVEEVVRYTDTDGNGFLDTVEFDYDGDRTIDLKVSLLDYKTAGGPAPDVVRDHRHPRRGWKGLHEQFTAMANQSWQEALDVYRARVAPRSHHAGDGQARQRGLGGRALQQRLLDQGARAAGRCARASPRPARPSPRRPPRLDALDKDLVRLYYTAQFPAYVKRIAEVPGR